MADTNHLSAPVPSNGAPASNNDSSRSNAQHSRGGRGGAAKGEGYSRTERGWKNKNRGGDRNKGEMGRKEHNRNLQVKKNERREERAPKRQKLENGEAVDSPLLKDEIEGEARRPKRKVAVMIGYAGTGYKGMQINVTEKTIEGDIFKAFIAAGAISKANADDPKKSSLVRCARTDKGVHAAGNVISLKLIVEDSNIVQKINENLPPQIRMWGYERTNGSFSCYTACDSRWYEYLIPTYSFLPPHPHSWLGKEVEKSAKKEGVYEAYQARQEDVATFWEEADKKYLEPILEKLPQELRIAVMAEILKEEYHDVEQSTTKVKGEGDMTGGSTTPLSDHDPNMKQKEVGTLPSEGMDSSSDGNTTEELAELKADLKDESVKPLPANAQTGTDAILDGQNRAKSDATEEPSNGIHTKLEVEPVSAVVRPDPTPLEAAVKKVKAAMISAKKAYRISLSRQNAVQDALNCYVGTRNFHNYTVQKNYNDPSAKRVIRSFKVGPEPIIINNTEWLSLKVHGQSFMMHQIRKMIAMAALVVRCGNSTHIMEDSFGPANISIPKAPSLGLLLERPVFQSYNDRATKELGREKIDFDKYEKEMNEFKQREIYDRIFREEDKDNQFHIFFNHIDHYRSDYFLWVTASGIAASKQSKDAMVLDDDE